ncbi:MAG: hypothetical protein R2729_30915 [Bryobacteraceae bacterium]
MRQEDLARLPQYWGLYFDRSTGMTYHSDGTPTGWTFENATWSGPFNFHFQWPFLNPLGFATHETAVKVLAFAKSFAPPSLQVWLDEEQKDLGPFYRTVERQLVVSDGGRTEQFGCGWIANSIIRNGEKAAAVSMKAEWRTAGFTVPGA